MDLYGLLKQKSRLIVLIPEGVTNLPGLAHKIHWLSMTEHQDVIFLAISSDTERILSLSRTITTLKAEIAAEWLNVTTKMTTIDEWLSTLKEIYQPGDKIICHEEQAVKAGFLNTMPASDFLRDTFRAPVQTISGFYHPQKIQAKEWISTGIFWIGCLVVLAIFTLLEVRLEQNIHGYLRTVILTFLVLVEVGSLWAWSGIKG